MLNMFLFGAFASLIAISAYSGPLVVSAHSPTALHERGLGCSDAPVKSLVSIAKAAVPSQASAFCSSYLGYGHTITVVTTVAPSTATVTTTVKAGSVTVTTTVVVTRGRGRGRREQATIDARAGPSLFADAAGRVAGFPENVASAACSCFVPQPTRASTVTKTFINIPTSTKTVTIPHTKTKTTTITVNRGPRTTTQPVTPSASASFTSGPRCTGVVDPVFYIQFQDPNPQLRTDQFNNQYLAQAPDEYRGVGTAVFTTTPSLTSATLVILECATGRLRTVAEGWYANAEYFLNITPVYFDPADWIERNEWQFLDCTLRGSLLTCYVQYPSGRSVMQTCPDYVDFYYTPVSLGEREYTDGPVCYAKNMVVIPVS